MSLFGEDHRRQCITDYIWQAWRLGGDTSWLVTEMAACRATASRYRREGFPESIAGRCDIRAKAAELVAGMSASEIFAQAKARGFHNGKRKRNRST